MFDDESSSRDKNSVGEDSAHVCGDAGDIGPAPLQNVLQPDEEFVGTTNQNGEADNAFLVAQGFHEFDALNQDTEEGGGSDAVSIDGLQRIEGDTAYSVFGTEERVLATNESES